MPSTADPVPAGVRALHVVVVAYGAAPLLEQALRALHGRYPVTVVDNSSDHQVQAVVERAGARYVDPGVNLGFAAGVNLAVSTISLDHTDVLLLNPDAVIEPAELDRLHRALAAEAHTACVAPGQRAPGAARSSPGTWRWHTPWASWAEALGLRHRPGDGFLSGALLLLRSEALTDVGPFDERFFLYAEEEDWQHRARRRGWALGYHPEVTSVHDAGGTQTDIGRLQLRLHSSTERYLRKWYGVPGWYLYRAGVVAGQLVRAALRRGPMRRSALALAELYLAGPDRTARRRGVLPGSSEEIRGRRSSASDRDRGGGTSP